MLFTRSIEMIPHLGKPPQRKAFMDAAPTICLFSSLYLPTMGGVQTYTASIARAFRERGARVIVVCCALQAEPGLAAEDGIEVLRLPCRPLLGGRYPVPTAARKQWEWLESQHIDFIEVNTRFYPLSEQALAFAERKGVVPVLLEHGSAHLTMGNAMADKGVQSVEHFMTRRCLRHPSAFYAVSKKASRWLRHFGIASCGELPNSIDADAYASEASDRNFRQELDVPKGALLVASVGRLVPEKGVLAMAEASRSLNSKRVVMALGGDGPLHDQLKAAEHGGFHVLGRLTRPDVAALLSQADLMCLPSRSEGFATSLLEAAACGTPALVTDVGGTDELIPDERFGTILPDMKPGSLSEALERISENPGSLAAQGRNVAERVREGFSWAKTADATLKAFEAAQHRGTAKDQSNAVIR